MVLFSALYGGYQISAPAIFKKLVMSLEQMMRLQFFTEIFVFASLVLLYGASGYYNRFVIKQKKSSFLHGNLV